MLDIPDISSLVVFVTPHLPSRLFCDAPYGTGPMYIRLTPQHGLAWIPESLRIMQQL
jgi:hypothetical protein